MQTFNIKDFRPVLKHADYGDRVLNIRAIEYGTKLTEELNPDQLFVKFWYEQISANGAIERHSSMEVFPRDQVENAILRASIPDGWKEKHFD